MSEQPVKKASAPRRSTTKQRGNGGNFAGFEKGLRLLFRQRKFAGILRSVLADAVSASIKAVRRG